MSMACHHAQMRRRCNGLAKSNDLSAVSNFLRLLNGGSDHCHLLNLLYQFLILFPSSSLDGANPGAWLVSNLLVTFQLDDVCC
jgi:hypothetical protein